MTPIPLISPTGAVYAYACSRCHHVAGGSSLWGRPRVTGPHEQLTEASLYAAERCCTCHDCGVELSAGAWLGRCAECDLWGRFGIAWANIGRAAPHGSLTAEEWDRWRNDEREEEEEDDDDQ